MYIYMSIYNLHTFNAVAFHQLTRRVEVNMYVMGMRTMTMDNALILTMDNNLFNIDCASCVCLTNKCVMGQIIIHTIY